MFSWGCSEIAKPKTLANYPAKHIKGSPRLINLNDYTSQPTNGLKTPLQILSGKAQKEKGVANFQKFENKLHNVVPLSSLSCNQEFRIPDFNKNPTRKMFPVSVRKLLKISQEKIKIEIILLKWQDYYLDSLLKNHFMHFSRDVRNKGCFASFKKFLEKRF